MRFKVVDSPWYMFPDGTVLEASEFKDGFVTYSHPISGDWIFYLWEIEWLEEN
jgi:hypothetical protein